MKLFIQREVRGRTEKVGNKQNIPRQNRPMVTRAFAAIQNPHLRWLVTGGEALCVFLRPVIFFLVYLLLVKIELGSKCLRVCRRGVLKTTTSSSNSCTYYRFPILPPIPATTSTSTTSSSSTSRVTPATLNHSTSTSSAKATSASASYRQSFHSFLHSRTNLL